MMKALIVAAPGDIRMIETEKPNVGAKDVLAKVMYAGICGTDLAILSGDMSFVRDGLIKYPIRIGHEWSGIVEEVGEEVIGFKPGDRVVSDSGVTCGKCEHCLSSNFKLCENIRSVGTINCWDGSFSEYMIMPYWHMHKLPNNISMEEAALIEPTSIALSGVKQSNISSESRVLVVGTGPIGIAAVSLAKNAGAAKVLLSGRKKFKLDVGKTVGADAVVNVTKEDLRDFIMKNTEDKGVDVIIETSGNIEILNQCLDVAKPKALIALIGFYEKNLNDFNIDKFVVNRLQMKGILAELGLVQEVIGMMASESLNLKSLITHKLKFNEAIEAMRTANEKNDTKIKMLVEIGAGS